MLLNKHFKDIQFEPNVLAAAVIGLENHGYAQKKGRQM